MTDVDRLAERLDAVERAFTDGDHSLADLEDAADLAVRVEELTARVDELEAQVTTQEAALQAVRGYVGNIRAVNEAVEARADAALAKAQTLEAGHGTTPETSPPSSVQPDHHSPEDTTHHTSDHTEFHPDSSEAPPGESIGADTLAGKHPPGGRPATVSGTGRADPVPGRSTDATAKPDRRTTSKQRSTSKQEPDLSAFAGQGDGWRDAAKPLHTEDDRHDQRPTPVDSPQATESTDSEDATATGSEAGTDENEETFVTRLREAL